MQDQIEICGVRDFSATLAMIFGVCFFINSFGNLV